MADLMIAALYPEELPPPESVNHFRISRVGPEVQILLGYIDLGAIATAIGEVKALEGSGEGAPVEFKVEVSHRLTMGSRAFTELHVKVDHIYREMVKSGDLDEGAVRIERAEDGNSDS